MQKPIRGQRALPFQTKEEAQADMYQRIVRMEAKLTKLLLHMGLDENGFPAKPKRRLPMEVLRPLAEEPTD